MQNDNDHLITEYNNESFATRLALSPAWSIGWFAGTLSGLFNKRTDTIHFVKDERSAYKDNPTQELNMAFLYTTTIAGLTAGLGVSAAETIVSFMPAYMAISVIADRFGAHDDKKFGAMKAGYAEGQTGGLPKKPSP